MLENNDIIYIGNSWFTENKTSSHHIAEVLSENNRILYVEASGQRAPRASKRDIQKIFHKLKAAWSPPLKVRKNIFLYSPLVIPFHKYKLVARINETILQITLNRARMKVGFSNPLLWILLPHFSSVVGKLHEKGVVYYCVDEYSSQANVETEAITRMEKVLLERADVVFAVSEKLRESKRKENPNVYLSLHGVDTHHFGKALEEITEVPNDIASIPRPIAGFFGLIEERVDLGLIHFLASRLENVSFVLIGLVSQDISLLKNNKNVHFLGPKPYRTLPNYLKVFDVCLLPYKLNTEMINSNPKKLREYLAGGKAVVSVRIREVERYREFVRIADNYEEFLDGVDASLREDSGDRIMAQVRAMKKESWNYRVEQVCQALRNHLKI